MTRFIKSSQLCNCTTSEVSRGRVSIPVIRVSSIPGCRVLSLVVGLGPSEVSGTRIGDTVRSRVLSVGLTFCLSEVSSMDSLKTGERIRSLTSTLTKKQTMYYFKVFVVHVLVTLPVPLFYREKSPNRVCVTLRTGSVSPFGDSERFTRKRFVLVLKDHDKMDNLPFMYLIYKRYKNFLMYKSFYIFE